MLGACTATLVLILNVAVTAWSANNSPSYQRGIVQLMVGPCSAVRKRGTWLHVAINLLSTTLLGASNYAMQCLSAPTRKEVDRAHSKGQWVDIGIPSVKNFRSIHWTRLILWCLLALSSAPLHLLSVTPLSWQSLFYSSSTPTLFTLYPCSTSVLLLFNSLF